MGGQALRTVYEGKMKLLSWKNALRALIWGGGAAVVLGVIGIIVGAVYVHDPSVAKLHFRLSP